MADKARLFKIYDQPPVIQLFVSIIVILLTGTILLSLFMAASALIFGISIDKLLAIPISANNHEAVIMLKYIQGVYHISLFIVPAMILMYLMNNGHDSFSGMNKIPSFQYVFFVFILAFALFPVTGLTGVLNSKMVLPEWLSGVENWMRTKEDNASDITEMLIGSSNVADLGVNIIILALLPAFGEEMIFRGILQPVLSNIFHSHHAGIWITSVIFSSIHMQFFGFIPRLILGLSFGYLYYWTGNLWLSIFAHFMNNMVPVISSYFIGWKDFDSRANSIVGQNYFVPLFSAALLLVIFYYFRSEYRKKLITRSGTQGPGAWR
jgi:hypothetical protein